MSSPDSDQALAGSIPRLYDEYPVPLIFEPYAEDLANRLASRTVSRVLEVAAGTGVVTRHLASVLPGTVSIVATDLNQPMLDMAAEAGTARAVELRQAVAMQLPFDEGEFDAVVCRFVAVFFPDRCRAFSEARRVLRAGGLLLVNVWNRIAANEFAHTVTIALASLFPSDPPRFMARTPHGYHDVLAMHRDLQGGGFVSPPRVHTVAARSRASSPRVAALAYCRGTPLRNEIQTRDESRLGEATDVAAEAIARRFGTGAVDGKIRARIVAVER